MLGFVGVTAIDMMQPTVTLSGCDPEMVGFCVDVAVMVVVPWLTAVANPELLIVATAVVELLQVTGGLLWLPSSKVPKAVNCWVLFVVPV
jgi:hypothetical protein